MAWWGHPWYLGFLLLFYHLFSGSCSQTSMSRSLQRAEILFRSTFNPSLKCLFHIPNQDEEEENLVVAHNLVSRSSARLQRVQQHLLAGAGRLMGSLPVGSCHFLFGLTMTVSYGQQGLKVVCLSPVGAVQSSVEALWAAISAALHTWIHQKGSPVSSIHIQNEPLVTASAPGDSYSGQRNTATWTLKTLWLWWVYCF